MTRKVRVAIIYGGKSAEHEVSIESAKNVAKAIDQDKYELLFIGIDKEGNWRLSEEVTLLDSNSTKRLNEVALGPQSGGVIANKNNRESTITIDVVFPVLHGPFGEDGTLQGLLKLADIPFVGSGVLGSAVGMDKDVMKRLLRDAGLPIAKFRAFKKHELLSYTEVKKELGSPLFIKPANLGSSVGVNKVTTAKEYKLATDEAFKYDRKIIVEEFVDGREIECSVIGNQHPVASIPGEVISSHDYYSYHAKYIDDAGAVLEIPAKLEADKQVELQEMAVRVFKVLECEGFGRVDMFLRPNGQIVINEINTIPGFTSVSMFPKLFEASGLSYSEIIDRLIELAIERYDSEKLLKASFR